MSILFRKTLTRSWLRTLIVELEHEGYTMPEMTAREPTNYTFKNISAIRPEHREVFEKTLRLWKLEYLLVNTVNNDKNNGRYSQKLETTKAVVDTIEGFLKDPRLVWEE